MGRILFLDCFAGIAGDMTVAALVHAGAPLDDVLAEVRALPVWGWTARIEAVHRGAYAATRFVVEPTGTPPAEGEGDAHDHGHAHHHDHGHGHGHTHDGGAVDADPWVGQPPRTWRTIRRMLEQARIRPRVRARSLATFAILAEAEARVHGTPVEDVAFHEVGAVDSIVDIVAACAAMECLEVDEIVASPLPMGHGQVRTAHGLLPVPVPATVEVLRGFPVVPFPFAGELVTPTGAALVAALARPGHMPAMRVDCVGYGAGTRNPSTHANVVRAVLGQGEAGAVDEVVELRAQVDDLTGESVPGLIEALFAAGAVDAYVAPVTMKKGRPALAITALAAPSARVAVGDALIRHAGTLGYRWSVHAREVAARRLVPVQTPFGTVRVKIAERDGRVVHAAPEHEDCAALALAAGVPVALVRGAALAAWSTASGGSGSDGAG
ncbi:MAG: nickel pincer cofactor biosynthesis protein LarC [Pseudomonadota bacterium]|nr:nickel pincer cofactor biosynthesis protein LarC [Pseudomonadota bacterium]